MIHPTNFHLHGERSTCHQKVAAAQRRKVKLNIFICIIFLIFDHEFVIPEPKENNNSEEKIKKKKKKKKQRQVAYYNI